MQERDHDHKKYAIIARHAVQHFASLAALSDQSAMVKNAGLASFSENRARQELALQSLLCRPAFSR